MSSFFRTCIGIVTAVVLSGCSTTSYFWQAATGHLKILSEARNIDEVIDASATDPTLREKLEYVKDIRAFSVKALGLPDNGSYKKFADLHRRFAVWNVVAAPVDSLELKKWCFPFTGCVSYKGFYDKAMAESLVESLRKSGMDVALMGVPAYSTLGYTNDPVLSTFIRYPPGELARLIFHELAHQEVYVSGDTTFNESFATAVEELGVAQWLDQPGKAALKSQYLEFDARRKAFQDLIKQARIDLKTIYNDEHLSESAKLIEKAARIERLKGDYERLKATAWHGWSGYDLYFGSDLNNAKLGVSGLYNDDVAAFKALFDRCGHQYPRFYQAVKRIGDLSDSARKRAIDSLVSHLPLSPELECGKA
ncbi:aminopeptidase [Limnobacter litoralis]|uniref:aminopeptidase n=1 Tax=Limnobacter litoralis TaxID=481366 RepID=UPI0024E1769D|nr:aminopeptidase [Limnobacter litoralis]